MFMYIDGGAAVNLVTYWICWAGNILIFIVEVCIFWKLLYIIYLSTYPPTFFFSYEQTVNNIIFLKFEFILLGEITKK